MRMARSDFKRAWPDLHARHLLAEGTVLCTTAMNSSNLLPVEMQSIQHRRNCNFSLCFNVTGLRCCVPYANKSHMLVDHCQNVPTLDSIKLGQTAQRSRRVLQLLMLDCCWQYSSACHWLLR